MIRGTPPPDAPFVGRGRECSIIDSLLRDVAAGSSGSLHISGPAGIGKSALLGHALQTACAFRVLHIAGVESEMAFGYAGVHQLVLPLMHGVVGLPGPQRHALEAVVGVAEGATPDAYLVGLAVLNLLADTARAQPVLLVVDDAQWLDDESSTVLSFAARRLHSEYVAMIVSTRAATASPTAFDSLPRLELQGLAPIDARVLLTAVAGADMDDDVFEQLLVATEGNPLALTELPCALTDEQLCGAVPLPEPLPIAARLASVFETRLRLLDEGARTLLLLTAAERMGDPRLLRRAARGLGITWDEAVATSEAAALVTFTPTAAFRHPLVRSAVYYAAQPAERRAVHKALADALLVDGDADRRAWHLGAAATGPDEAVARELEAASERARQRGGASVAAAYLWRAAELTPDSGRARERVLEAARTELVAGRGHRAQEILERATVAGLTVRDRADAAWTEALIRLVAGEVREAGLLLARALADIDVEDVDLAVGMCLGASTIAVAGGHLLDRPVQRALAEGMRRIDDRCTMPPQLSRLALALAAHLVSDHADALAPLGATVDAATADLRRLEEVAKHHVHVVYFGVTLASVGVLEDRAWDELTRSWVQLSRNAGALAALPPALGLRSWLHTVQGRLGSADSARAEAEDLAALTGVRGLLGTPAAGQVLCAAWRGSEEETRNGARRMMQDGHERGQGLAVEQAYAALTVLEIGCGRYEAALRTAGRLVELDGLATGTIALADLVEAATRCADHERARGAAERLSARVSARPTPWARGLLVRADALLSTGRDADDLFRRAVDELSGTTVATERARTQLLHGEWLRRERRRREARGPLQDALEVFETIGAERFASRAAAELAATGEHMRRRSAPVSTLTPQEAQIARLAAAGERNSDIAAQLYITTSTVEYHLRKVFMKLGVTSRTQLAQIDLPA